MTMSFDHVTLGQRVVFGAGRGAENLAAEVARRGARRVMAIASPRERELAERVCAQVEVAVWFDDVVQHVPVEKAEAARAVAAEHDVDLVVSVGGGSTTGLAKAVALTTGLPVVAVPTTYAGSEATNVWGLTEDRTKTTGVDDRVLPATVVYDAALTTSLPVGLSVASGLNGLAHCVDSLWAPRADPINQALALEGARALAVALPGHRGRPAATWPRASRRCTGATWPRWRSPRPGRACTTRSATSSAAPSTCRTPRRTRRCCATSWPSTPRRCPTWPAGSRPPSGRPAGPGQDPAAAAVAALNRLYDGARRAVAAGRLRADRRRRPRGGRPGARGGPAVQPGAGDEREPHRPADRRPDRRHPDRRPGQALTGATPTLAAWPAERRPHRRGDLP